MFTQSERQHETQMTAKQSESSSQKLENDIKYASSIGRMTTEIVLESQVNMLFEELALFA